MTTPKPKPPPDTNARGVVPKMRPLLKRARLPKRLHQQTRLKLRLLRQPKKQNPPLVLLPDPHNSRVPKLVKLRQPQPVRLQFVLVQLHKRALVNGTDETPPPLRTPLYPRPLPLKLVKPLKREQKLLLLYAQVPYPLIVRQLCSAVWHRFYFK